MAQVQLGTPNAMSQLEAQREALIKANKMRLAELEVRQAAQDLDKTIRDQDRAKKCKANPNRPKPNKMKVKMPREAPKRSARLQNKEPVKYCELPERESRVYVERRGSKKKVTRRYNLLTSVDLQKEPWWAWQAAPKGWKPHLGTASAAAAAAAERAGEEFRVKLEAQGRKALPKQMTDSQVSGGFWCNCPEGTREFYGDRRREIDMVCWDQADRDPDSLRCVKKGTTAVWGVVFNPRTSNDAGWSGGWRGFAIDHMLTPVDTVVFEVLDNAEGEAEVQKAKDMWAAKATALQQQQDKEDKDEAGCIDGEDPSSSGASCEGEEQEEEQSAAGEEQEGDQRVQEPKQAGKGYIHKDAPSQRKYVRAHILRASAYESEEEKQKQEAARAAAAANAAAEEAAAAAEDAAAEAADAATAAEQAAGVATAAAAAAGSTDAAQQVTRKRRASKDAAVAADGSDGSGAAAEPKQKQQKQGSRKAAEKAAAAKGAGGSKKRGRQQEQDEEQAEGSKKKAKSAAGKGAAAAAVNLVPQPVNKKVLVPPPTEDEKRRNVSAASFAVERIMGHKVVKGEDQFLVRWETFGPYWDEWVSADCLNAAPHTYDWEGGSAAMPAKFKPGKSK